MWESNTNALQDYFVAVGCSGTVPFGAAGQGPYPDHAITYVPHVSPGGATEVMARALGALCCKTDGHREPPRRAGRQYNINNVTWMARRNIPTAAFLRPRV
jgi:hypothetical protein